jgi:hypothetical protein
MFLLQTKMKKFKFNIPSRNKKKKNKRKFNIPSTNKNEQI